MGVPFFLVGIFSVGGFRGTLWGSILFGGDNIFCGWIRSVRLGGSILFGGDSIFCV